MDISVVIVHEQKYYIHIHIHIRISPLVIQLNSTVTTCDIMAPYKYYGVPIGRFVLVPLLSFYEQQ